MGGEDLQRLVEKQATIISKQAKLIKWQAETIKTLEAHRAELARQVVELEVEATIRSPCGGEPPDGYRRWTLRLLGNKAVELGALPRAREIKTPEDLLKLIFRYVTEGTSFGNTAGLFPMSEK